MTDADRNRALATNIRIETCAWFDGAPVYANSGKTFVTRNPATGAALANVTACDASDMDHAAKAAHRSFGDGIWARCDPIECKEVLLKLMVLLLTHREELAVLECLDSGETIRDCQNEVVQVVPHFFQWYAETIDKSFRGVAPTGASAFSVIVKEPIGVAGLIDQAFRFARALPVGTVSVKSFSEGSLATPFGGYRRSGSLSGDKGLEALGQYQQKKTIWIGLGVEK